MFDDPINPPKPQKLSVWDATAKAEQDFGIPDGLLRGLGQEESSGLNQYDESGNLIKSPTGATGAFQFTKRTARQYNVNRDDPLENIIGAAAYMKDNYNALKPLIHDDTERWTAAAIAHNRGLGAVQGMIRDGRFEPSGQDSGNGGDTRTYATRILNNWAKLRGGKPFDPAEVTPDNPTAEPAQIGTPIPDQFVDAQDIANGVQAPVTAPEAPKTLDAQRMSALTPDSPRTSVLYTPGEQVPPVSPAETDLPLADGRILRANTVKLQKFLADNKADVADIVSGKVPIAPLIGKVTEVKDTSQGPTVLTTAPDGTEVSANLTPTPQAAAAQVAVDQASFPGSKSKIVDAQDVVAQRKLSVITDGLGRSYTEVGNQSGLKPDEARLMPVGRENKSGQYVIAKKVTNPDGTVSYQMPGQGQQSPEYLDFLKQTGLPNNQASIDEFNLAQKASVEGANAQNQKDVNAYNAGIQQRQTTQVKSLNAMPATRAEPEWKSASQPLSDDQMLATTIGYDIPDLTNFKGDRTAFAIAAVRHALEGEFNITPEAAAKIVGGIDIGKIPDTENLIRLQVPRSAIANVIGADRVKADYDSERAGPTQEAYQQTQEANQKQADQNPNFANVPKGDYYQPSGDPLLDQARNIVAGDPASAGTDADIQAEYERLKRTSLSPEQAAEAGQVGGNLADEGAAGAAKSGIVGAAGRILTSLSGVLRLATNPLGIIGATANVGNIPNEWNDELTKQGKKLSAASAAEALSNPGFLNTGLRIGTGLFGDIPRFVLLSRIPGAGRVLFATDAGLQSIGSGNRGADNITAIGKGLVFDSIFHGAGKVADFANNFVLRAAKNPVFDKEATGNLSEAFKNISPERAEQLKTLIGGPVTEGAGKTIANTAAEKLIAKAFGEGARVGTIGSGVFLTEGATGKTKGEAFDSAITMAITGLVLANGGDIAGSVKDLAGKIFRFHDGEGAVKTVTVSPVNGEIKLLKGAVPDEFVDVDAVINPKAASPEAVSRGNQVGTSAEPQQLAETNPARIEQPDPAAVQKAQIDTRTRKVADALQGKDFTTVDEIAKATRLNKTNVEDAIMTLYGARMVEMLPGNRVRLINAEEVAKQSDLYERAKNYGQEPPEAPPATSVSTTPKPQPPSAPSGEPIAEPQRELAAPEYKGRQFMNPNSKERLTFTGELNENGNLVALNNFGRQRSIAKRDADKWLAEQGEAPQAESTKSEPYTATVHRGVSDKTPVDEGMYGKGEYWTTSEKYATSYGKTQTKQITLQRPFIGTGRDMGQLKIDVDKLAGRELSKDESSVAIRKHLEDQGYDGIVVKTSDGDEVVVFHPDKAFASEPEAQPKPETAKAPTTVTAPTQEEPKIPKGVRSLSQFVRSMGGIRGTKYDSGEHRRISNKETGTTGLINKNSEFTAERMARAAWEHGYLRDEFPTIADVNGNDFMGHVEDDYTGVRKHYSQADQDRIAEIFNDHAREYGEANTSPEAQAEYAKRQDELLTKQIAFLNDAEAKNILAKVDKEAQYDKEGYATIADKQLQQQYYDKLLQYDIEPYAHADAVLAAYREARSGSQPETVDNTDAVEPQGDNVGTRTEAKPTQEVTPVDAVIAKVRSFPKMDGVSVGISGSVAAGKAKPNDADVVFTVNSDVYFDETHPFWKEADAIANMDHADVWIVNDAETARLSPGTGNPIQRLTNPSPAAVAGIKKGIVPIAELGTATQPAYKPPANHGIRSVKPSTEELSPAMQAKVQYARERGQTESDIAQTHNLTPEQVASVPVLPPVGQGGQMSYKIIQIFTPSKTSTDAERADKIAMVNDLASELNLNEARLTRDAKSGDIVNVLNAGRLAVANEMLGEGKRGSDLSPSDWLKWLDTHADKLEQPTVEGILEALGHQIEHTEKKVAPFIEDKRLEDLLTKLDKTYSIDKVADLQTLPNKDLRDKIYQLGYEYGLKQTAIQRAYQRARETFLAASQEGTDRGTSGRGSTADTPESATEPVRAGSGKQKELNSDDILFARAGQPPRKSKHFDYDKPVFVGISSRKTPYKDEYTYFGRISFGQHTPAADLFDITDRGMYGEFAGPQELGIKSTDSGATHYLQFTPDKINEVITYLRGKGFKVAEVPNGEIEYLYKPLAEKYSNRATDGPTPRSATQALEDAGFLFSKPATAQTETEAFKRWFGDSKVVDENGDPLVVYHGTTHDFDTFNPNRANIENHFGKGIYLTDSPTDVAENYAGEGPDLTQRIELEAEKIFQDFDKDYKYGTPAYDRAMKKARREAKQKIAGPSEGMTMPLYAKIENPVYIGVDGKRTYIDPGYESFDEPEPEEYDEEGNETQEWIDWDERRTEFEESKYDVENPLIAAINKASYQYGDIDVDKVFEDLQGFEYEGGTADRLDELLRKSEGVIYATDDDGNLASYDFIKTVFQNLGFDGIIMDADQTFGSGRQMGKQMAMDYGTKHYIVFEPNQVKSAIGNNGDFSPSGNILFSRQQAPVSPLGFYSAVEQAILDKMPAKASAEQVRGILKPESGVKQAELEWLGLDQWLDERAKGVEPTDAETALNSVRRHADDLRNLYETNAFRSKGFGGLDVPSKRKMLTAMFGVAQNPEIRDAVIRLLPVDVVNVLRRQQLTPEMLFHDVSVFKHLFGVDSDVSVAIPPDVATSFIDTVALKTAKVLGEMPNTPRVLHKGLATVETGDGKHSSILPKQPFISKQEVLDFIRQNQVDVQEVVKGSPNLQKLNDAWEKAADAVNDAIEKYGPTDPRTNKLREKRYALQDQIEKASTETDNTKFSSYTLPGAEPGSYRELLLTMPEPAVEPKPLDTTGWTVRTVHESPYTGQRTIEIEDKNGDPVSQRSGFRGTDEEAIKDAAEFRTDRNATIERQKQTFQSSHFDTPNILVHVRFDDRDGGKTLHIAEIQSDLHAAGRQRGYKSKDATTSDPAVQQRLDAVRAELSDLHDKHTTAAIHREQELWTEQAELQRQLEPDSGKVPNFPFKRTYHELALKRMLMYAATHGYERLTFDTGATQADRYDLSKQVKSVTAEFDKEYDNYRLAVKTNEGTNQDLGRFDADRLPDAVGKDLAAKIIEDGGGTYTGLDLKVGGEGMVGFYDKMLPQFVSKYVKKFGSKVEDSTIIGAGGDGDLVDQDEYFVDTDLDTDPFTTNPTYTVYHQGGEEIESGFKTPEDAQEYIRSNFGDYKPIKVHSVKITDAMRESVAKGQPLFAKPTAFDQVDLFGNKVSPQTAQHTLFDLGVPEPKSTRREQQGLFDEPADETEGNPPVKVRPMFSRTAQPPLMAPNGKPSKLPPHLYAMVRTPEFKAWFGDWEKAHNGKDANGVWSHDDVSKVVDENGEPRIVYHGTSQAGFGIFRGGRKVDGAYWFTSDRHNAYTYAGRRDEADIAKDADAFDDEYEGDEYVEPHRGIYSVFLNLRNPNEENFEGANWDGSRDHQYEVLSVDGENIYDENGRGYFSDKSEAEELAEKNKDSEVHEANDFFRTTDSVAKEGQMYGHDGAMMHEVIDMGSEGDHYDPATVYTVNRPEQIKSVFNVGKFDPNNPHILQSKQAQTDEANATKFLTKYKGVPPENIATTSKAKTNADTKLLELNPQALWHVTNAIAEVAGLHPGTIWGGYIPPSQTRNVRQALVKQKNGYREAGKTSAADGISKIINAYDAATDAKYDDLSFAIAMPRFAAFSKAVAQEELSHRADGRVNKVNSMLLGSPPPEMRRSPAYRSATEHLLKQGYAPGLIYHEVTGKLNRDDAAESLGLTHAEVDILRNIRDSQLEKAGVTGDVYREYFKNISAAADARIERYGQRNREVAASRDAGYDAERGRENGDQAGSPQDVRARGGSGSDTAISRERGGPNSTLIRQSEVPGRSESGDVNARTPQTKTQTLAPEAPLSRMRNGISQLAMPEPGSRVDQAAASVSPTEAKYIALKTKGSPDLAKSIEQEILFARASENDRMTILDYAIDVANMPKALKASMDLSAFRQGGLTSLAHPKIAARAFIKQLKTAVSPAAFKKFEQYLNLHPFIELSEESGLYLASLAGEAIAEREEQFMSRVLGENRFFKNNKFEAARKLATFPIRASERAFKTFLDDLRINTFAALAKKLHEANVRMGKEDDPEAYRSLARFINYSTGRGDLGRFNDAAPLFNAAFFSMRYWMSRLQVMNPAFYAKLPPGARGIVLQDMFSSIAAIGLIGLLLKLAGGKITYNDPNDPDTLKVGFGDYTYDISFGLLKHLRYMARMVMATQDKDPAGKMDYLTGRYIRSSLAPVPGGAFSAFTGKDFIGQPTDLKNEAKSLFTPIMVDNFKDAVQANGVNGLIKMSPEFFGISTTRYATVDQLNAKREAERQFYDSLPDGSKAKAESARKLKVWSNLITKTKKYDKKEIELPPEITDTEP